MGSEASQDVTRLLISWGGGDEKALAELWPLVYDELRRLARGYMRREGAGHTLEPTALVNEAYLRLVDQTRANWQNRAQFVSVAAQMMRRILVNHAEAKRAAKRGGHDRKVPLDEAMVFFEERSIDLLALDEALKRLAELDPQQCRLVELRFFGGLTIEDTAELLGVSVSTVKREWKTAKTWLYRAVTKGV